MTEPNFRNQFTNAFDANFERLFRALDRISGDPELAADLTQDAFVRLYRRGSLPDSPEAWLISVALNLLRNARRNAARRRMLLTPWRGRGAHGDPPPSAAAGLEADSARRAARAALAALAERDRSLLLLRAEGYSYREIAKGVGVAESSVGTLLSRARQAFRDSYMERT